MRRAIAGVMLLAGALGGPYFLFESPAGEQFRNWIGIASSEGQAGANAPETEPAGSPSASVWGQTAYPNNQQPTPQGSPSSGWFTSTPSYGQPYGSSPEMSAATPTSPSSQFGNNIPQGQAAYPSGYQSPNTAPDPGSQQPHYPPIQALQEVLRFDVSPNWVLQRFPKVTSVTDEARLHGLQVPLTTGSSVRDLSGTITYYFDAYKRVQRIHVHAVTGDPSRFLAELQHTYQLQYQPSLGGDLFVRKWNGRPTSLAYTAMAPVVTAENANSRYRFFAELNQGSLEFGLSSEAQQLLASQSNNRWQ